MLLRFLDFPRLVLFWDHSALNNRGRRALGSLQSPHLGLASFLPSPGILHFHHLQRDSSEGGGGRAYPITPFLPPWLGSAILFPLSTVGATCPGLWGGKILFYCTSQMRHWACVCWNLYICIVCVCLCLCQPYLKMWWWSTQVCHNYYCTFKLLPSKFILTGGISHVAEPLHSRAGP